jgi:hypothetical protein
MTTPAIHVHIGRLVVDGGFDRVVFERALAQGLAAVPVHAWSTRALDRLRFELGPQGGAAADAGAALARQLVGLAEGHAPARATTDAPVPAPASAPVHAAPPTSAQAPVLGPARATSLAPSQAPAHAPAQRPAPTGAPR